MLQQLDQEPKRLAETIRELESKIKAVSVKNCDIHIRSLGNLVTVRDGSKELAKNASGIHGILNDLSSDLTEFRVIGTSIFEKYKRNMRALSHHVQLLELLELPQLMETCSRNNLFDEALDLSSFANTLQKRHHAISAETSGGKEIIFKVAKDVGDSTVLMRNQLLQQLRQQINLPSCLRVISYLKRLDAQDKLREGKSPAKETSLRFQFLECRDAYVTSLVNDDASMIGTRPYQSISKLIERCRVSWFDVITQYKAIFGSGETSIHELYEDEGILSRWISGKMIEFLVVLGAALDNIDDLGSIANLLEQSMYFGLSLSRVGVDFRSLLVKPFQQRILAIMSLHWRISMDRCQSILEGGNWGEPLPAPRRTNTPSEDVDNIVDDSLLPPNSLLQFPIIAETTNDILSSFNQLRQCASPVFALLFGRELCKELGKVVAAIVQFKSSDGYSSSEDRFAELCDCLSESMLPYLQRCFDAIFDQSRTSMEIKTFLEIQPLVDSIAGLNPTKPKPTISIPSRKTFKTDHILTPQISGSSDDAEINDNEEVALEISTNE